MHPTSQSFDYELLRRHEWFRNIHGHHASSRCPPAGLRQYARRIHRPGITPWREHSLRWLALPVLLVLIITAFLTNWPMRQRFAASMSAFDAAAASHLTGTATNKGGQRIGLNWVNEVRVAPSEVMFQTGVDLIDPTGFDFGRKWCGRADQSRVAENWCTFSDW